MSNDRFCVDCKHCQRVWAGPTMRYMCISPKAPKDLVDGGQKQVTCKDARHGLYMCGRDAGWFEACEQSEKPEPIGQKSEPPPTTETWPSRRSVGGYQPRQSPSGYRPKQPEYSKTSRSSMWRDAVLCVTLMAFLAILAASIHAATK